MKLKMFLFLVVASVFIEAAAKVCIETKPSWLARTGSSWSNSRYTYTRFVGYSGSNYGTGADNASAIGTWSVTATVDSIQRTIVGIAQCASNSGTSSGTAGTPTYGLTGNLHCWCRMTSPLVGSSWVFQGSSFSAGNCANVCADYCGGSVDENSTFRAAVVAVP